MSTPDDRTPTVRQVSNLTVYALNIVIVLFLVLFPLSIWLNLTKTDLGHVIQADQCRNFAAIDTDWESRRHRAVEP